MDGKTTRDRRHHLFDRRCVACGHDGPDVQMDDVIVCPLCGCDLLDRPPRSYAEMEGFDGHSVRPFGRERHVAERWSYKTAPIDGGRSRALERWLLFLFFSLLVLFAIAALAAAAMQA